jgi:RNA polymerase primary sigma factor
MPSRPLAAAVVYAELHYMIREILQILTPREQRILGMRFGIDENEESTLQAVGRGFGLSRERIRQIQTGAINKLRKSSKTQGLESFMIE